MSKLIIPDMNVAYNPINGLGGVYNNRTFSQIFPSAIEFAEAYENSGLAITLNRISADIVPVLYYLLMAKYRNDCPMSYDENRFKADLFSIVFASGPSWEAQLRIQKEFRDLIGSDELTQGSITINNHSYNPSTEPSTDAFDALTTIDDQSATGRRKPKIEAYAGLVSVLKNDVSAQFIEKFKPLFRIFEEPDGNLYYTTTRKEQEILNI